MDVAPLAGADEYAGYQQKSRDLHGYKVERE